MTPYESEFDPDNKSVVNVTLKMIREDLREAVKAAGDQAGQAPAPSFAAKAVWERALRELVVKAVKLDAGPSLTAPNYGFGGAHNAYFKANAKREEAERVTARNFGKKFGY